MKSMADFSRPGSLYGAIDLGARKQAIDWIYFYAGQATSGGEGVWFSAERDRFLAEIGEWDPG